MSWVTHKPEHEPLLRRRRRKWCHVVVLVGETGRRPCRNTYRHWRIRFIFFTKRRPPCNAEATSHIGSATCESTLTQFMAAATTHPARQHQTQNWTLVGYRQSGA